MQNIKIVIFDKYLYIANEDRDIFTVADQYKIVYSLSNGAIFNDLERPQTQIFKVTLFFDAEYLTHG